MVPEPQHAAGPGPVVELGRGQEPTGDAQIVGWVACASSVRRKTQFTRFVLPATSTLSPVWYTPR